MKSLDNGWQLTMDSSQEERIEVVAKKAFNEALAIFKSEDKDLPMNVHERTAVSRIAHYLANIIENNPIFVDRNIKVDVEYNRDGADIKRDAMQNQIIVDLVVHRRKDNNSKTRDNILVCEFKNDSFSV